MVQAASHYRMTASWLPLLSDSWQGCNKAWSACNTVAWDIAVAGAVGCLTVWGNSWRSITMLLNRLPLRVWCAPVKPCSPCCRSADACIWLTTICTCTWAYNSTHTCVLHIHVIVSCHQLHCTDQKWVCTCACARQHTYMCSAVICYHIVCCRVCIWCYALACWLVYIQGWHKCISVWQDVDVPIYWIYRYT